MVSSNHSNNNHSSYSLKCLLYVSFWPFTYLFVTPLLLLVLKIKVGWMKKNLPMPSLSSWKEVMIQISPFHDSSSFSLFSAKQHCVCHVFDDDHPLSTAHDFQGSASLLLLFMCALWSALKSKKTGWGLNSRKILLQFIAKVNGRWLRAWPLISRWL